MNIGVDVWNFMPVSFQKIAQRAKSLPVNKHWADVEPRSPELQIGLSDELVAPTNTEENLAQFLVWSDLHDELWEGFELPELTSVIDGVLIAHDTNTMGRHLDILAQVARKYNCLEVTIWETMSPTDQSGRS